MSEAVTAANLADKVAEQVNGRNQASEDQREARRKAVQPRINELVQQRDAEKAEREAAQAKATALEAEIAKIREDLDRVKSQPQVTIPENPKPERDKFASDEEYAEALADYRVQEKLNDRLRAEQEARAKSEFEALAETFKARAAAFRESTPDYEEVLSGATVNIPEHLYTAILESEAGPQLAYHYAKNPQDLRKLMSLRPVQQARELIALESRLNSTAKEPANVETPSEPAPPRRKAPPPPEPLKSAESPVKDPTKMSPSEFRAWRLAGGGKK